MGSIEKEMDDAGIQIVRLALREQLEKTEAAEIELETARIQLETTRSFVRVSPGSYTRKPH